jgi:hypothetical protein
VTNLAKFTINATASSPGGFDGATAQVLTFALEGGPASLVQRWTLQVYDAADASSPLASYGAPSLSLVGATTGQKVDAATPGSNITCTLPSGMNSWIVRSKVNGGLDAKGKADPNLVFERMVVVRDGSGRRKTMATEATQYGPEGWARAVNEHLASVPSAIAGGTEVGQKTSWNGSIYVPQRDAIQPSFDLTGLTDSTTRATNSANLTAGLAAAHARGSGWVLMPDAPIALNDSFTVQRGCALTGRHNGMNFGHKQYDQVANIGTLLKIYGTGKFLTMEEQSTVEGLQFYQPNQVTNADPSSTPYDYTIYCAAGNHGPTITNCVGINPYKFIFIGVNGATVDAVQGAPLSRGIDLGRCAEVVRISRVLFNGGGVFGSGVAGATLIAWVLANGTSFSVDGAEAFEMNGCFSWGYRYGLDFKDLDADAQLSYGSFRGGGLEAQTAIRVAQPHGLARLQLSDLSLVGLSGSAQPMIDFQDTALVAGEKPGIYASNVCFSGTSTYNVKFNASSFARYMHLGGEVRGYSNYAYGPTSANNVLRYNVAAQNANVVDPAGLGNVNGSWFPL